MFSNKQNNSNSLDQKDGFVYYAHCTQNEVFH